MTLRVHGRHRDAEGLLRSALERWIEIHGEEHPRSLHLMFQLAVTLRELGHLAGAEEYYRRSYEGRRKVLGEDNTYTMFSLGGLALVAKKRGKFAEAEPLYRTALEVQTTHAPPMDGRIEAARVERQPPRC